MNSREAAAVWLLSLGQLLNYAALYYGFPSLLPDLVAETGWSKGELALGPTVLFVVMAVLTPFTGRLVDRGYGGGLLMGFPIIGALAFAGLGLTHSWTAWLVLWAVVGVAGAGSFYETCFAVLTRRLGQGARAAITRVTLVAGLAGTLTFPLGHWLGNLLGAHGAIVAMAGLVLFGALPMNIAAMRLLGPEQPVAPGARVGTRSALRRALAAPAFWIIAAIFGLLWLSHSMFITYALILFEDRGVTEKVAVLAAACFGPAQVAGRLFLLLGEARIGNSRASLIAIWANVLAASVLWAAGAAPVMIFAFVGLQGMGAGLMSILRPVLQADHLGRDGFGAISGVVAIAPALATAVGPSIGAVLLDGPGPVGIYASTVVMAATSLGLAWLLARRAPGEG